MSLINDALKRARQAQNDVVPPPSSGPGFRPSDPETDSETEANRTVLQSIIIGLVVTLILFLGWQAVRTHRDADTELQAKAKTLATPQPPEPISEPEPAPAQPEPVAPPAPAPAVASVEPTNVVTAPTPPKLQAIIYNPARPSAIIDGKTLFIGETIGDLRLASVTRNSATLVGKGQTNRLTLAQ